jgi:hypothetical protein
MNLEAAPDAPFILHFAAAALLWLHIGGGTLGILSGWTTMVARKGGRLHRVSGNVFFVSMLVMAGIGAAVSPFLPDARLTNTTAGVFTFYLVASGWATVKRRAGQVGGFEKAAVLVPLAVAAFGLYLVWLGSQNGKFGGYATIYIFAAIAALAATCDLRMIQAGGVSGVARTARHLWRMTLALFVATGSFFMGQQDVLPEAIRGGLLPVIPTLAVPLMLIYWMIRVRVPGLSRALRGSAARAAPWLGKPAPRS